MKIYINELGHMHTCQVSRFERDAHEFERLSRPHNRILKNTHSSRISRIITIFVFYRFNNFLNHVINTWKLIGL